MGGLRALAPLGNCCFKENEREDLVESGYPNSDIWTHCRLHITLHDAHGHPLGRSYTVCFWS